VKSIIIKNLIINYPYVYKIFFGKTIPENRKKKKNSIFINLIKTGVSAKTAFFRKNPIAFRTLPKIIITLNDSVEFRGLINLNTKINYIDKATYEQLINVIIILNPNIEIISYSNHRVPFIKIYKNIRLAVKPIKYEICLFIIDVKTSYFLVLGIFFLI
jgi:hypothetical protein